MVSPVEGAGMEGLDSPSIALICDYWLGGPLHTAADRQYADYITVCAPHMQYLVRAQRALLRRLVRYLVEHGVRQFLDLGSGVPTVDHVHEVAQGVEPASRVVYVDFDPRITDESRALLANHANVAFLQADIRFPRQVLEAPEVRDLLDFSEPVAVLMIETLPHISDSDNPAALIKAYGDALCPGSYLALSQHSQDEQLQVALGLFSQMRLGTLPKVQLRGPEQLASFFIDFELVEPGIVPIFLWHPDSEEDIGHNPELCRMHVGLGRKA